MKVIFDSDQNLKYETNSFFRKLFNFFFIPLLNILPSSSKNLIKKSHKSVHDVVENTATYIALETLYNKGTKIHTTRWTHRLAHWLWFDINNSKAVRNRILIVIRELRKAIEVLINQKRSISILSIASGSARAVVESIKDIHLSQGVTLSSVFLDKDSKALEYSKELLKNHNLLDKEGCSYTWINDNAGSFLREFNKHKFNVVEMVGLLDYFDDEKAVNIFKGVYNILDVHGIFITANINHNLERAFLTRIIGWKMIYRSAEEINNLLLRAGFEKAEINLYYEPLKIHIVAVATKK